MLINGELMENENKLILTINRKDKKDGKDGINDNENW